MISNEAVIASAAPESEGERGLIRALGVRQLTASIINMTVGAGIFVLPAAVAADLGAAAPIAFLICAVAMVLIVMSFAMAGSRVNVSGGVYAYVEVAFGRFPGFITGVLLWLSCVLASSGVASAFVVSLGELLPAAKTGIGRFIVLLLVFAALATINIRGVKVGARTVEFMTVGKLLPLIFFVAAGLFYIDLDLLAWPGWPDGDTLGKTVLLLMFAFTGVEMALTPSGEVKDPSRTVPLSILSALALTTILYILIQLVAQGILGGEMRNYADAPLAEAASRFLGEAGRLLVLVGALISMFGFVSGDALGTPRTLFAFGRDGILPAMFARIHPVYRTPHVAIIAHTAVAFVLSMKGSFVHLALLSNIAILLIYLLCSVAAIELTRRDVRIDGAPFVIPGARIIPVCAAAVVLWILSNATFEEVKVTAAVLAGAMVLYLLRRRGAPAK